MAVVQQQNYEGMSDAPLTKEQAISQALEQAALASGDGKADAVVVSVCIDNSWHMTAAGEMEPGDMLILAEELIIASAFMGQISAEELLEISQSLARVAEQAKDRVLQ